MKMSELSERVLLDTNVLVYADQEEEIYHPAARSLRDRGKHGEIRVCLAPQVLSEFFAIVTKTGKHRASRPMSVTDAAEEVQKYLDAEHIPMIYPTPTTWPTILSLLERHPVSGQDIHDFHLAATMLSNGVTKIYTFNAQDFVPIPGIEVLDPLHPVVADETEELPHGQNGE